VVIIDTLWQILLHPFSQPTWVAAIQQFRQSARFEWLSDAR
jgi:hypothetical protein